MKKIIIGISLSLLVSVIISFVFLSYQIKKVENTILQLEDTITFEVGKGASLYSIKERLKKHTDINDLGFKLWVYLHPEFTKIKAGLYEIEPDSKLVSFIKKLHEGEVKQFAVTLVEGQTFSQWMLSLQEQAYLMPLELSQEALYEAVVNIDDEFCQNQYQSLEGCLLPDTYFYTANTPSIDIIKRAYAQMRNSIGSMWPTRFKDIPINNKYEALILASIIEKETAIASERSEIAGVFANRLEKNMRLQTDPTVIYGIGESFNGDITRKDLRAKTPYNTYVIKGLPITPIAMPSAASIEAALMPAITDSLYFVASGEGGHVFSTNLADHNRAVRQYLAKMKEK